MAKETLKSAKEAIIEVLGQSREGMGIDALFMTLAGSHDVGVIQAAFWNLVGKHKVLWTQDKSTVYLEKQEWLHYSYKSEASALEKKLEEGLFHKKIGHQVKIFEQAGIGKDVSGVLPVSSGKKERQQEKLAKLQERKSSIERRRS